MDIISSNTKVVTGSIDENDHNKFTVTAAKDKDMKAEITVITIRREKITLPMTVGSPSEDNQGGSGQEQEGQQVVPDPIAEIEPINETNIPEPQEITDAGMGSNVPTRMEIPIGRKEELSFRFSINDAIAYPPNYKEFFEVKKTGEYAIEIHGKKKTPSPSPFILNIDNGSIFSFSINVVDQ